MKRESLLCYALLFKVTKIMVINIFLGCVCVRVRLYERVKIPCAHKYVCYKLMYAFIHAEREVRQEAWMAKVHKPGEGCAISQDLLDSETHKPCEGCTSFQVLAKTALVAISQALREEWESPSPRLDMRQVAKLEWLMCAYISIYMYVCVCIYIYIYISILLPRSSRCWLWCQT
jgi:hypothetical protein